MKTRIADVQLNLDDPDHQRWAFDDAYDEIHQHPQPKRPAPPRSRYWWFWRAFGYIVFSPARMFWAWYSRAYFPELRDGTFGSWTRRHPSSERLKQWIGQGGLGRLSKLLYWLLLRDHCICPHCGFTDYGEEHTIYASRDGEEDQTVDLFEHVDGGGVDYWGEGQDAYGWMWCWRCGNVSWETI